MKKIVLAILLVGTVVAGTTVYTSTPEYKTKKELSRVDNKIEGLLNKSNLMVKNQKHGAKYTRQQWEQLHEELEGLREERKSIRARVK